MTTAAQKSFPDVTAYWQSPPPSAGHTLTILFSYSLITNLLALPLMHSPFISAAAWSVGATRLHAPRNRAERKAHVAIFIRYSPVVSRHRTVFVFNWPVTLQIALDDIEKHALLRCHFHHSSTERVYQLDECSTIRNDRQGQLHRM